jgi:agmatine deiminase
MTERLPPLSETPPAKLRWPAEWEPSECVWLTWPQNEETWQPVRGRVEVAYERALAALAPHVPVRLLVNDPATRDAVATRLGGLRERHPGNIELLVCPTQDSWIRDYGGFTTHTAEGGRLLLDWRFNSWGGKYPPWDADDAVPLRMAERCGIPCLSLDFVLEGGSVDTNGQGLLLTTEQCLLNPNRNPTHTRDRIEETLHRWLGVHEFLWLEQGIAGDDTDGHIDDIARFVTPRVIVAAVEHSRSDENYENLKRNLRRLEQLAGRLDIEVVELPMPQRLVIEGLRTPASYTNFLFANDALVLPIFDNPADEAAVRLFEKLLPHHRILPVDCRHLVFGQGAIHCSSMQTAAAPKGNPT